MTNNDVAQPAAEKCVKCGNPKDHLYHDPAYGFMDHEFTTADAEVARPVGAGVELKRCPLCGREGKIEDFFIDDDPTPWYVATCVICPLKTYDQLTAEEAASIWNTRVTDQFRDLCRSALAIARRRGDATNWDAFVAQLENAFRSYGGKKQ